MRNYIILNGNNSNEITGLLIQTLPPISQPKIRTNIEEIDGRDGDIITKLGYSAYDKEISIGLYGNYDVDDIIKYFTDNQSGKVTFSDEPDKYYYYEILDQVDFDKLIRYRTATVTLHCQPFKYSTTEEKIQIDATEVSGSGSSITLNNTEDGALFTSLQINGDTSQFTTTGKNLLDSSTIQQTTKNGITCTYDSTTQEIKFNGTCSVDNTNFEFVGTSFDATSGLTTASAYYVNGSVTNYCNLRFLKSDYGGNIVIDISTLSNNNKVVSITSNESRTFTINRIRFNSGSVANNFTIKVMFADSTNTSYEPYTGGMASPNPDYPQNVDVVTGDNTINVCGKNLWNENTQVFTNQALLSNPTKDSNNVWTFTSSGSGYAFAISKKTLQAGTYTFSFSCVGGSAIVLNGSTTLNNTFTLNEETEITIRVFKSGAVAGDVIKLSNVMIEKSSTATPYTPYVSQTYSVDLGSIELCKIGDYQDYIYKENGNWYKYSEIGKVVLDGSENWEYISVAEGSLFRSNNSITNAIINNSYSPYCNYYKGIPLSQTRGNNEIKINNSSSYSYLDLIDNRYTTASDFKTWLGTHNTSVYYPLATPTITQITDDDLITQLEALIGATTYLGQTNIITSGSALNPLLDVTTYAVDDPSFVITNSGNFKSKPIITIYGLGTIGLYLNGIQVLSLDMGETTSQITIDVAKLEAYNQETGALMNRSVTGDYNNLSLNVGENTITESGTLQGIEIENYSRWL